MPLPLQITSFNGGAEEGDLTGWTVTTGAAAAVETDANFSPGPRTGAYFFSITGNYTKVENPIDISSASSFIDSQGADLLFGIARGAFAAGNDKLGARIEFLDANTDSIVPGEIEIVPFLQTIVQSWHVNTLTIPIPPLARYAKVTLIGDRRSGGGTQAYFDDITLAVIDNGGPFITSGSVRSFDLWNYDGEGEATEQAGALVSAWNVTSAPIQRYTGTQPSPLSGDSTIRGGVSTFYRAEQQWNLEALGLLGGNIDSGDVTLTFKGQTATNDASGDSTQFGIAFYLADGTTKIGTDELTGWQETGAGGVWEPRSLEMTIPASARAVNFLIEGWNSGGGSNNTGCWEDLRAHFIVAAAGGGGGDSGGDGAGGGTGFANRSFPGISIRFFPGISGRYFPT